MKKKDKNKKRKIRKRDRGKESALFQIHKNFEDSSLLLKKVREQIQTDIDSGKLRGKVKEKMEAFILLTTEVDKTVSAYDMLLKDKPAYSPPYIHKTEAGQRVSFQTWDWVGENYKLTQYIIEDESKPEVSRFTCEYRATRREELTELFLKNGCKEVIWEFPEDTGFYQPILIAKK